MHEMAIAQGILEIALDTAASHGAGKITRVRVLAGELTGVVPEALDFGFNALAAGTIAAGACLAVQVIPLMGRCRDCGQLDNISKYRFICEQCGSSAIDIVSGRELTVESVEVE